MSKQNAAFRAANAKGTKQVKRWNHTLRVLLNNGTISGEDVATMIQTPAYCPQCGKVVINPTTGTAWDTCTSCGVTLLSVVKP
jgi:predicted RNA-binding Zn-ribbon protein involved in translation (DUF1610 family)